MNNLTVFDWGVVAWMGLGAVIFVVLLFIEAPYGRYARRGWGTDVPARLAWMLMESVALLVFTGFFVLAGNFDDVVIWILWAMYAGHYIYRSWLYPMLNKGTARSMPLLVVLMALLFNCINGAINGQVLFIDAPHSSAWPSDPRFVIGLLMFVTGLAINIHSDLVLRRLRGPGESGYKIPEGGLYRWISCPNYFGEILEWCGFALACWTLPGLAFAVWTLANLGPRALHHHRWYKEMFANYPSKRRALIPFVI